jgi:formiminoglutamate deiminase
MTSVRFQCEWAWLPGGVAADVLIEVVDGRFATITPGTPAGAAPDVVRLPGVTLPGFADAHSHAFHRALRGRTQGGRGTFWTWREQMYSVAGALDPDSYHRLATAVYAEMALAGITCVGEFHYLHHGPGGTPYADPNAMGEALIAAASTAGIRITLLDTLYLTSSVDGRPLEGIQRRFGDTDVEGWAERVARLAPRPHAKIGAAAHSVRAVPAAALGEFARHTEGRPTHVHLSEQRAENEACLAVHGRTPTQLLADRGLTGPTVTAVHATHLTDTDRTELGDSGTGVCFCPTTERDLADGIGHARALVDAGSPLSLGSDSHAVIDLFEEARGVEMHERLHTEHRGHFTAAELLAAATATGHASLGWTDAGGITPGARADLVTVSLTSPRTAGCAPESILFTATAADIQHVVVDGRVTVRDGTHLTVPDVGAALTAALRAVDPSTTPPQTSTPFAASPVSAGPPRTTPTRSTTPGTAQPSPAQPRAATPQTSTPCTALPGPAGPPAAPPPRATTPGTAQPSPAQPRAATPQTSTPSTALPGPAGPPTAPPPRATTPRTARPIPAEPQTAAPYFPTDPQAAAPLATTPIATGPLSATQAARLSTVQPAAPATAAPGAAVRAGSGSLIGGQR